ncbi:hypothetical protein [Massilia sp. CF038]|uniref:hypothetical protein n=1 Tax=Massilia sp. CF038 TaxID=1881045 RepID=UPI0009154406|nr:hypothetical protein [Massilia sp. CF038]SHG37864.1 hypothetical protein SAMN05428948_0161 [Massilia sp. CF038]
MIPFRLNKLQFQDRYRGCLNRLSVQAIKEIQQLLTRPVPSDIKAAEVQIFVGVDDPYLPSAWIYFEGKNNRVDPTDMSIFPRRSIELGLGLGTLEEFDDRYFTDNFGGKDIVANVLKTWFAECWWKAGGWSYAVPATVSVHDQYGDASAIELSEHGLG